MTAQHQQVVSPACFAINSVPRPHPGIGESLIQRLSLGNQFRVKRRRYDVTTFLGGFQGQHHFTVTDGICFACYHFLLLHKDDITCTIAETGQFQQGSEIRFGRQMRRAETCWAHPVLDNQDVIRRIN